MAGERDEASTDRREGDVLMMGYDHQTAGDANASIYLLLLMNIIIIFIVYHAHIINIYNNIIY